MVPRLTARLARLARLALLVLLAGLVSPAVASAQEDGVPIPAGAPVVAGAAPSQYRVVAFDRGSELCVGLRAEPASPGATFRATCQEPPGGLRDPRWYRDEGEDETGDSADRARIAVVDRAVTSVAVRLAGGRVVRAPAEAGDAYRGRYAGRVRFALAELPRGAAVRRLDVSDGADRLLAVEESDLLDDEEGSGRTVARGRVARGGATFRVRAALGRTLSSTLLDPARVLPELCVAITIGDDADGSSCAPLERPEGPFTGLLSPSVTCHGTVAAGVVPERAARVTLVAGDGRRVRGQVLRLPAALGGVRFGLVAAPPALAVRRIVVADAAGRALQTTPAREAPGRLRCGSSLFTDRISFFFTGGPPAGPPVFTVRDGPREGELCAALGTPDPARCGPAPARPRDARLEVRRESGRTHVGAVLPEDAAALELELDGGERVTLPATTEGGGYAGPLRGLVRFAATELPGERQVVGGRVRTVSGLGTDVDGPYPRPFPGTPRPRRLIGGPRPVSAVAVLPRPGARRARLCLLRAPAGPVLDEGDCELDPYAGVSYEVACGAPGGLRLSGVVARGTRARLVLASGRRVPVRVVDVPRALPGRVAVLEGAAPRAAAVAALELRRGRRVDRRALALPAATAQCGYRGDVAESGDEVEPSSPGAKFLFHG